MLKKKTRETADLFMALIMHRLMHLLMHNTGKAAVVLPDGFLFGEGVKSTLKRKRHRQTQSAKTMETIFPLLDPVILRMAILIIIEKACQHKGDQKAVCLMPSRTNNLNLSTP